MGNELNLPVYKINFAKLVSKYIGETEKNLEKIFDRFTGHPGILFFDEAESIFSKRTEVKDSHDKHANNEQSYLLQKLEEFSGIIILAKRFENRMRNRLRNDIVSSPYGEENELKNENGKLEGNTGVELGYSFEKLAYGFVDLAVKQKIDQSKWAGNFDANFERKYYQYLKK